MWAQDPQAAAERLILLESKVDAVKSNPFSSKYSIKMSHES